MPKSYKDEEIIYDQSIRQMIHASSFPVFAIHNPKLISIIAEEKPSIRERISNKIYCLVTFWTPILMAFIAYGFVMYGLIEVVNNASR